MNYDNFKNSIIEESYRNHCNQVWSTMYDVARPKILELNKGVKMISIDVPGLMIFATAIMAYLIICFAMGIVASIYITLGIYFTQNQLNHTYV